MMKQLTVLLFLVLLVPPAAAHKVQVAEDVGATLHIEPNDTPTAGKPALTWFALTRKGGQVIPLQQCNCQLSVYSEPRDQNAAPILSPPLKSVSAERYQGIPGAEINFPKPGAYQLQLNGTPTAEVNFKPFQLKFTVTVAAGKAVPKASQETAQLENSQKAVPKLSAQWLIPIIALTAIISLGIAWGIWRRLK